MAEKIVSPGVFTKEIDASFLPAAVGDIGAAIVGPTVKGPAMVPTVVSSYSEFQSKFGDSFLSGSNYYTYLTSIAAQQYLRHSNKLTVVRILDGTYGGANAEVPAALGVGAVATGSVALHANFMTDEGDELRIVKGGTTFRFQAADPTAVPDDNPSGNLYFHATGSDGTTAVNFLTGSVNGASIGFTAVSSSNGLEITASTGLGNNGVLIQTGSGGTFSTVATLGGAGTGASSTTSFKLNTQAHGAVMNNIAAHSNAALAKATGSDGQLLSGSVDNLRWEVTTVNNSKGTFTLLIRGGNDTEGSKNILETHTDLSLDPGENNYIARRLGDSKATIQGAGGTDPYLKYEGNYPNKSKYVYVSNVADTVKYLDETGAVAGTGAQSASLPAAGSGSYYGSFAGGLNGVAGFDSLGNVSSTGGQAISTAYSFYDAISATDSQGYSLDSTTEEDGGTAYIDALNLLANGDEYDINLLLLPGIIDSLGGAHAGIITKAVDVCEKRGDTFLIYDTVPYSEQTIANVTSKASERNSNYAATYWPWVQIADPSNGAYRWVPPSTVLAGIYSFNDKISAPWFAPAGLNRGGLDSVVQAGRKLTHANRDDLYASNVNPIATFPGQGVCVWGQKTLQKKSSALDRVNVRRLMIKVKKFISASSRFLVFEQNNTQTRERFLNIVNPYLEQVQAQSGLNAFKVVMDDTNNTPDVVDRNILYGQLFLQPTRTAEFIVLDFTIQPTGAAFPE